MTAGIPVMGVYVRDQHVALEYQGKPAFRVPRDARNGSYRELNVQHPDQPGSQLGLLLPGAPVRDEPTLQSRRALVAKGVMPPVAVAMGECWANLRELSKAGAEFTLEPCEPYGAVDAGVRVPTGNGWKMIERPTL